MKVTYRAEQRDQEVSVTSWNNDGTVNVRREDGREFINVPVSEAASIEGHVFIAPAAKAPANEKPATNRKAPKKDK